MIEGIIVDRHVQFAVTAFRVGQRLADDLAQIVLGERGQLEDAAAADQRFVDLEVGIFRGGTDKDHGTIFYPRQQGVLLRFVKAMDFIHKERGALAVEPGAILRLGNRLTNLLDTREHGVEGNKVGLGCVGDHLRQRCFAGAGRPIEDQAAQLIRLDRAAQQAPRPDDVRLADVFIQGAWPHPCGERRGLLQALLMRLLEKVFGNG